MMNKKEIKNKAKEEGVVWVSSSGTYYSEPEITAEKLRDLRDNVYGRSISSKLRNLVFRDKYTIEVLDANGERDEELEKEITLMCEQKGVRLWANMQRAFSDIVWFGIGLQNPVWEYVENKYTLKKLRHLPAYTFANVGGSESEIYSEILQGITIDEENEIAFWQTNSEGEQVRLENVFYIKDPVSDSIAGESIILPIVPIIEMLKFVWNTQIQQANRTGAKIIFIKVTNPQPASNRNGGVGDVEYANEVLQKWGKDQAFQIRENMEIVDPGITDNLTNLEIISALERVIIDYITPTSFISKEGNTLGGSEIAREELFNKYIEGIHGWLADQYEMLLSRYLEYNEYKDYTISINIPSPFSNRSDLKLKQATAGFTTKCMSLNEIRILLDMEEVDEETEKEIVDYYASIQQPIATGFEFSTIQTKKETPEKVTRSIEDLLSEAGERLAKDVIKAIK